MNIAGVRQDVLYTLSYYDIFRYPMKAEEIYRYLPSCSSSHDEFLWHLHALTMEEQCYEYQGYYSLQPDVADQVERRRAMEQHARTRWPIARVMTHVIKRFPFVRCILITGTLGKNLSAPGLDIDYFIITEPNRLWIVRTLLILFKKTALLNSYTYFCLNYFVTEDNLEIRDKNIFTAAELAHAKVLYNEAGFRAFLDANSWFHDYFPNWKKLPPWNPPVNNNGSFIARMLALPLRGKLGDALDDRLMKWWEKLWNRRYSALSPEKRADLFRVTKGESKAHPMDFQTRILDAFSQRCQKVGVRFALDKVA